MPWGMGSPHCKILSNNRQVSQGKQGKLLLSSSCCLLSILCHVRENVSSFFFRKFSRVVVIVPAISERSPASVIRAGHDSDSMIWRALPGHRFITGMIVISPHLGALVVRLVLVSCSCSSYGACLVLVSCSSRLVSSRLAGHSKRCVSSWQADVSSGCFKQAFVSVFMRTVFM